MVSYHILPEVTYSNWPMGISYREKKQRPETTSLKLARWNIRTMQDSDKADQPQGCSALVKEELAWLDIDIAALCRVRFAKQGSIKEHGAGYTLYWSDISREDHRLSREDFMLKNMLASKLTSLPLGHSDRLMPPYPPGQSIHHHHQCVCSHTHSRPCDQRGLLQQLKVPPLKSRQRGQAHHHGQL